MRGPVRPAGHHGQRAVQVHWGPAASKEQVWTGGGMGELICGKIGEFVWYFSFLFIRVSPSLSSWTGRRRWAKQSYKLECNSVFILYAIWILFKSFSGGPLLPRVLSGGLIHAWPVQGLRGQGPALGEMTNRTHTFSQVLGSCSTSFGDLYFKEHLHGKPESSWAVLLASNSKNFCKQQQWTLFNGF